MLISLNNCWVLIIVWFYPLTIKERASTLRVLEGIGSYGAICITFLAYWRSLSTITHLYASTVFSIGPNNELKSISITGGETCGGISHSRMYFICIWLTSFRTWWSSNMKSNLSSRPCTSIKNSICYLVCWIPKEDGSSVLGWKFIR